jgi:hypothetical protein
MRALKIAAIGFITGLFNGLFGSGGGMIVVPAMSMILGIEEHDAHATALSIILPLTIVSIFIYSKSGIVDWQLTWKVALGGVSGGYIGARLLHVVPADTLRKIFAVFMIIAAVRMIF